jgi:tetratricopeptide (TPR) repeat protein
VLEAQRYHAAAADQYRRALGLRVGPTGEGQPEEVALRSRLAFNLAHSGAIDEAIAQGRAAVELAAATLDETHPYRMRAQVRFAEVLRIAGRPAEALVEIDRALVLATAIAGDHSTMQADVLRTRGALLLDLHRPREAVVAYAAACPALELLFEDEAEEGTEDSVCWAEAAVALVAARQPRVALERGDHAVEVLLAAGEPHDIARAHLARADALRALGRRRDAATEYEAARASFAGQARRDIGYEAAAELGLARAIERDDPTRARELVTAAVERFALAPPMWAEARAQAEVWLERHRPR